MRTLDPENSAGEMHELAQRVSEATKKLYGFRRRRPESADYQSLKICGDERRYFENVS